jgi:hypothetical protein
MKGSSERFGVSVGVLLALLANGCEAPAEEDFPIMDSLAVWRAEVEVAVGGDDSEGPGTIRPIPLGASPMGDIYVLDPQLLEVQRYDSTGRYRGLLVGPGQGPGEMRSRPLSFGLGDQGVWFTDGAAGRIHLVSFDGGEHRVVDTGFGFEAMGAQSVRIEKIRDWEGERYLLETLRADPTDRSLRPTLQVGLYRSDGAVLDTLHEFSLKSRHVALDGGRSSVSFPGPLYDPVVLYDDGESEVVIIERPHEPAGTLVIQRIEQSGTVMTKRLLRVAAPELSPDRRARIKERLLTLASFGGARSLDPGVREELEQIVDELPRRFPAFDEAALGPEGTIWVRRAGLELDGEREWLVFDRSLEPVARALVPTNASELSFRNDGAWWAVMDAWLDKPYVARLSFVEHR